MINKKLYILYNIIVYLLQPIFLIKLFFKGIKNLFYFKKFYEKYGFFKKKLPKNCIIIHAVSIGEIKSILLLIIILKKIYPNLSILLTTTTISGMKYIKKELSKIVYYSYFPYDTIGSVKRFLYHTNPQLVIIIEREIWPNFINEINNKKIPIIIANARLSKSSANKYKKAKKFFSEILNFINIVASNNKEDGMRFLDLGLERKKLKIIGNIKFDVLNFNKIKYKKKLFINWEKSRPIWIASSTHYKEENIILSVHKYLLKNFPNLLLIIVPRHEERFKKVIKIIKKFKFNFITRSSKKTPSKNTQIILGDSIGELMMFYKISDISFIGGSLLNYGGHNPLEAAINKLPIITGPYVKNFYEINMKLRKNNSLIIVNDKISLISWITILLNNKDIRKDYGIRAFSVCKKNTGSLNNLINLIKKILKKNK
ncbi:kdtA [Wigglesworthia glossinidia endosymbiont of Glossina brevipalpis]|uniref:3-deoxy-D-manno-octulosonic acid transferase n=1 Tax=Wigglesworthia glossinidia brevipalpis TaxID=36870 RepID=Q8D2R4_WIGBR|nr:kdtA [Wigglesworthia glossinidia endosymbiont of Glossina brevipalpis]